MSELSTGNVPPTRLVRALESLRARLRRLSRRLVPAPMELADLVQGAMLTQALSVVAELRVADVLAEGPRTAAEIAGTVEADPDALYRVLRLLASQSVFVERSDGRFALTPMARALRSDSPSSMRDLAILMGHPTHWEDWSHFAETVRTGEPSLPKTRGMPAFEYLAANPEYGAVFGAGMGSLSQLETRPVIAAYDFSRFRTIVDYGGGNGALLASILRRASSTRGILFDSRAAGFDAETVLKEAGVAERCTIEDGGLFDPAPVGADAFILKHIVHDWPRDQALRILRNVRAAIRPNGRLLLMEFVLPTGNRPHLGKLVDLWLMLLVGGRERTPTQYSELLSAAGFRLTRVVRTASAVSIVEAMPAD